MKTKRKNKKGVTLIELMTAIAVMGILASIVTISLSAGRQKAQASSVLQSMTSVAPLAYKCLTKGTSDAKTRINIGASGSDICLNSASAVELSSWPDITSTGWSYGGDFYWCKVNYSGTTHPTGSNVCNYADGTCGGDWTNKKFCYGINNTTTDQHIWCTDQGCQKEGF
ncbi:MAG: type II secretion system protein [Parcubacteria group bacterium]|jgi:prepilin-type N-terminal cleavage/methylation domain-containing protein